MECLYNLQTFGIRANDFPIDENGNISAEHHRKGLERRRAQERKWAEDKHSQNKTDGGGENPHVTISVPSSYDVLLGRGVGTNRRAGNIYCREVVSQHVVSR